MDQRDIVELDTRYIGQRAIRALEAGAAHALERAGMSDVLDELVRRVLARDPEERWDMVQTDAGSWQVSLKPMIELLLHEVRHVARAPHVSDDDRRVRIQWAMTMAGV